MKRLRAERKRTEAGRKIIRDRKIINASSDESIVLWENQKHVRAYRKRLKKKNPEKHHMNKLKDRVRKRKEIVRKLYTWQENNPNHAASYLRSLCQAL